MAGPAAGGTGTAAQRPPTTWHASGEVVTQSLSYLSTLLDATFVSAQVGEVVENPGGGLQYGAPATV